MKRALLLLAVCVLGVQGALRAQSPDSLAARADALFAAWDSPTSPGAALAVIRDGEILHSRGYGAASLEHGAAIRPSTVFHVASISKHFTSFAVALLEEEGKLSLDDDVRKHVPELPDFGRTVTLRHLVHHTSGLRDQWELLAMSGWRLDDVITQEHILKTLALQRELNFAPGEEYLYSNSGYTLLAVVVERVSGKSLRDFAQERIFGPLGMASTHFHDDHEMIVPGRAYSYAPAPGGGFRNAPLNYANAGATSLFTTVEDMARWDRNFTRPKVGTPALVRRMHTRGVLNGGKEISYARGLAVGEYRGLRTVAHGGADAGYRTYYLRFPDQGYSFVVFSNLSTFDPGALARRVADLYLEKAFTRPGEDAPRAGEARTVKLPERELAARVGVYVNPRTDVVRRIEMKDGRLMLVAGPGYELAPLGARRFRVVGAPVSAEVAFETAKPGSPFRLVQGSAGGEPDVYRPVVTRTPEQLAEYGGTYASEELGTSYTLSVREGKLVLGHRRHPDVVLTPTLDDRFSGARWPFQSLRFERDAEGHVTSFLLSGGRVRNLRLQKAGR